MSAEPRRLPTRRKSTAHRPKPRTVEVAVESGDFEGWRATVRVDFPAKVLEDMQSGNVERIMRAAELVILEHNFPDSEGFVATRLTDVDPFGGIVAVLNLGMGAIKSLPPR